MNCVRCGIPLTNISISDEGGMKHPRCYHLDHPYKPKQTLGEVLSNGYDMVLARDLVLRYTSPHIASLIIEEFNQVMQERYLRQLTVRIQTTNTEAEEQSK